MFFKGFFLLISNSHLFSFFPSSLKFQAKSFKFPASRFSSFRHKIHDLVKVNKWLYDRYAKSIKEVIWNFRLVTEWQS